MFPREHSSCKALFSLFIPFIRLSSSVRLSHNPLSWYTTGQVVWRTVRPTDRSPVLPAVSATARRRPLRSTDVGILDHRSASQSKTSTRDWPWLAQILPDSHRGGPGSLPGQSCEISSGLSRTANELCPKISIFLVISPPVVHLRSLATQSVDNMRIRACKYRD